MDHYFLDKSAKDQITKKLDTIKISFMIDTPMCQEILLIQIRNQENKEEMNVKTPLQVFAGTFMNTLVFINNVHYILEEEEVNLKFLNECKEGVKDASQYLKDPTWKEEYEYYDKTFFTGSIYVLGELADTFDKIDHLKTLKD